MLKNDGNPVRRTHTDPLAMDEKRTAAEICEARDAAQQRGLAAARGTHDAHDLVVPDRKRQLMEGDHGTVEEKLAGAIGKYGCINGCARVRHAFLVHATGEARPQCGRVRQVSGKNQSKAMRRCAIAYMPARRFERGRSTV